MIGSILSWLSSGVLDRILDHAENRMNSDVEKRRIDAHLAAEQIRGELEARKEARKVLIAESGYFWSAGRVGRLLFVLPLGFWWAAICLDSVFLFGWGVAEVPVLREWGGVIITSLFLVDGGRAVARGFAARGKH